jgi:hypothetical protein
MRCGIGGATRASHDSTASEARADDLGRNCAAWGIPATKSSEEAFGGAGALGTPKGTK